MALSGSHRVKAVIDLGALAHNFNEARRLVGGDVKIWPAVKADAYGHGAVRVVETLAAAGADGFCIATPEEAFPILEAASDKPIILLGCPLTADIPAIIESRVQPVVSDIGFAKELSDAAYGRGVSVSVHVAVDTGMGRIGFQPNEAALMAARIDTLPALDVVGVKTHYACSDESDLDFSRFQTSMFAKTCDEIFDALGHGAIRHAANSGAILALPESYFDAVRPGIMIYGCYPGPDAVRSAHLRPVMTLAGTVGFIKEVPVGASISYGRTWTARRPSRIATVNIGYGDGLPRSLSNRGCALVRGRLVPIAGRVCMDQTMLDVTDIDGVSLGDEAVFWGIQDGKELSLESVCAELGAIPYELTTQVTSRTPREYIG